MKLREKYLAPKRNATAPAPAFPSANPPPINVPPPEMMDAYADDGKIPVLYWYFDNTKGENKRLVVTRDAYSDVFKQLERRTFSYYGDTIRFFYDALEKYPPTGKTVLVWGLESCNCEAFALWKGASVVYVVDYNTPDCRHERITTMTHQELRQSGLRADFAFSFSSFEHDGLGRYGDPLAPFGDLQAMAEAKKHLRPGGIMFFGVPLGSDRLVWNAHRIYGPARLPALLEGWDCLEVFGGSRDEEAPPFYETHTDGNYIQPLMVLRLQGGDGVAAETNATNLPTQNKKLHREICGLLHL